MKWATRNSHRGFTIIELLVVIVVIAILAAVSIVAYTGIQKRANSAAASAEATQASKGLLLYYTENGKYPASLASAGLNSAKLQYTGSDSSYCVTATSGSVSYRVSNTATTPIEGGCAGHGVGGVAPITNLMPNPVAFSNANNWDTWSGTGGSSSVASVSAAWGSRGRAARATWSSSNTADYNGDLGYYVPSWSSAEAFHLRPNTQYTASWKVRTSKGQRLTPGAAVYRIVDGAINTGTGTTNASSGAVITSPGTTYNQWITFTTGPNTVSVKLYTSLLSGSGASYWMSGDYIEMTDFILVQGSSTYSFADGASPNWIWNGTSDNATSTGPPL